MADAVLVLRSKVPPTVPAKVIVLPAVQEVSPVSVTFWLKV